MIGQPSTQQYDESEKGKQAEKAQEHSATKEIGETRCTQAKASSQQVIKTDARRNKYRGEHKPPRHI